VTNRSIVIFALTGAAILAFTFVRAPSPASRPVVDAAELERYASENAQIQPPKAGEERIVFMGDSITDFWGRRYGRFFDGKPYINRGISAQTTPQMLPRFRQDVIALQPKLVVILAGTNDIGSSLGPVPPEAMRNNLMSMCDLARANRIGVVLSSLLPVNDYFGRRTDRRPPEKLKELNAWIKDYDSKNRIVYLDYWQAMLDDQGLLRKELTSDGLHPNDAGYELMGGLAGKAIAEALRQKD
jgi:lysophospholipase L1-like esterase